MDEVEAEAPGRELQVAQSWLAAFCRVQLLTGQQPDFKRQIAQGLAVAN